ncbi:MAG TPA: PAC2 family protein [Acidimicrobiia bacterium]|jgi:predicted ATP-grasp superfamily ATP-dependent carboligase|nr:PAC2 family protein [Acidimicrobiia bacterium]
MSELEWEREWPGRTSILVVAFAGYFDAASAATGAVDHLIEFTDATRLASIDGDPFFDAQQVRPHVVLEDGVTRTIVWPENAVHANDESDAGRELVLLSGIEPHYHWRRFTGLLVEVAEHTGAQVVVTLGAMPSQIPHSRMPLVHASSANPELAQRFGLHRPRYQGITGIVGSLQAELDARNYPAISMQVGVPYYAAGAQNWKASAALLRNLEHVTGIPTGHGLLQERVAEWEQLVDEAVAENPEASGYLPQLEAEYDRQAAEQLPSSEDLAAEFERYLRELDDPPS